MDGLFPGIGSIVPMLPDQSTINRSTIEKPPVEISPLPTNSFMSENASAELLNNPFTLSLDIKGGGENSAASTVTLPHEENGGANPGDAYSLSLSGDESNPIEAKIALEMSRIKEYELLGKAMARQPNRVNPENVPADISHFTDEPASNLISEKVRALLTQSAALDSDALIKAYQSGEAERIIPQNNEVLSFKSGVLDYGVTPSEEQPEVSQIVNTVKQNLPQLPNLPAMQLSASDIETILTLEPELQETFLNMFSNVTLNTADKPTDGFPGVVLTNPETAEIMVGQNILHGENDTAVNGSAVKSDGAVKNDFAGSGISKEVIIQQALRDIPRLPLAQLISQVAETYGGVNAASLTDEELARLAAQVLAGIRAQNGAPVVNKGDMDNLQKINELPYSLYLFGNVTSERKKDPTDDVIPVTASSATVKKSSNAYLRLSEAVRMASVLHNIYYGGSGNFPEETPWYVPYARYAVKHDIVKNGEFPDLNEYATRADIAHIFAGSVPKAEFPVINYIYSVPDVSESIGYGADIYLLLRAGVLFKRDMGGLFHPESLMLKTEAATIIGRIATPYDRKRIV